MTTTRRPAIEGWFTVPTEGSDEAPRLIGTRCSDSGTYFFPPERVMSRAPGFADSELVDVELSTRGRLWSYTDANYQPPEPYIPVTDPARALRHRSRRARSGALVVMGQVVAGVAVDDLKVGMEMELVLDTLYTEADPESVATRSSTSSGNGVRSNPARPPSRTRPPRTEASDDRRTGRSARASACTHGASGAATSSSTASPRHETPWPTPASTGATSGSSPAPTPCATDTPATWPERPSPRPSAGPASRSPARTARAHRERWPSRRPASASCPVCATSHSWSGPTPRRRAS